MARKAANLASALEAVTPAPAAPTARTSGAEPQTAPIPSRVGTALVGAHLPTRYQRALKVLSAETGVSQRDLLEQALDMLFVAKGARDMSVAK